MKTSAIYLFSTKSSLFSVHKRENIFFFLHTNVKGSEVDCLFTIFTEKAPKISLMKG